MLDVTEGQVATAGEAVAIGTTRAIGARNWTNRKVSRVLAATLALVLGAGSVAMMASPENPAEAETITSVELPLTGEPPIGPTVSHVVVQVAGSRNGASGQVNGLNGVWLGLYTQPSGGMMVFRAKSAPGSTTANENDTSSTADGIVRFALTNTGRLDPDTYPEGKGARPDSILGGSTVLYLRALDEADLPNGVTQALPDDWHFITELATNEGTEPLPDKAGKGGTIARPYAFPVPTTGALTANRLYLAGSTANNNTNGGTIGFMPKSNPTNTATTNQAPQTASGGVFTVSADNGKMPTTCENLNVALILDISASVKGDYQTKLKDAASQLVSAFTNTGLSLQLYTFGTNATRRTDLTELTPSGASNVKSVINSFKNEEFVGGTVGGVRYDAQWTNWDAALWALQPQAMGGLSQMGDDTEYDVAIFLTDGLPTTYGGNGGTGKSATTGSEGSNGGVFTDILRTERAVQAANALKERGTHIEVLGIGDAAISPNSLLNLGAVADDASVTTENWDRAARTLRLSVLKPCLPSVTVTKYERPWYAPENAPSIWDQTATNPTLDVPAADWKFTISDLTPSIALDKEFFSAEEVSQGSAIKPTNASGSVFYKLDAVNDGTPGFDPERADQLGSLTVAEKQEPGFNIVQQFSKLDPTPRNAQCVYISQYTTDAAMNGPYGGDVVGTKPSWVDANGVIHFSAVPDGANTSWWIAANDATATLRNDAVPTGTTPVKFARKVPWIDIERGGSSVERPAFRIVDMAVTDMVRCTMINQAMRPLEIVAPGGPDLSGLTFTGTHVLDYEWNIDKHVDRPAAYTTMMDDSATFNYQLDVAARLRPESEGRAFTASGVVEVKNPNVEVKCEKDDPTCVPKLGAPLSLAGVKLSIDNKAIDSVTWTYGDPAYPAPCETPVYFKTPGWVVNGLPEEVDVDYVRSPNSTVLAGQELPSLVKANGGTAFKMTCDAAGNPVLSSDGQVVAITRNQDYAGLATEPGLLKEDHQYRFALRARTEAGVGQVPFRFVAYYVLNGQKHYDWVNPTSINENWSQVYGSWRVPTGAQDAAIYLGSGDLARGEYTYFVDDLVISEITTYTPQVTSVNFDDESFGDFWIPSGAPALSFVAGGADGSAGKFLDIARAHNYEGIETAPGVIQPGTSYEFSMRVRTADGVGAKRVRFVGTDTAQQNWADPTYSWIGDTEVNDADWTTVSGSWVTPLTSKDGTPLTENDLKVYLGSEGDDEDYDLYVDNIVVRRLSTGGTAKMITAADNEPYSFLDEIIVAPGASVKLPLSWASDDKLADGVEAVLTVPYRYRWTMLANQVAQSSYKSACPDANFTCWNASKKVDIPNPNSVPLALSEVNVLVNGAKVTEVAETPLLKCGKTATPASRVLADVVIPTDCLLSVDLNWTGQPQPQGSAVLVEIVINKRAAMKVDFTEAPILENYAAYLTDVLSAASVADQVNLCDGNQPAGVTCDSRGPLLDARVAGNWAFNYSRTLNYDNELATVNPQANQCLKFNNVATVTPKDAVAGDKPISDAEAVLVCPPQPQCEYNGFLAADDPTCRSYQQDYDAALRVWGQRMFRNTEGQWAPVYEYEANAPTTPLPYLGFNRPDIHLMIGDAIEYAIQVTNQGYETIHIDGIAFHPAPGVVFDTDQVSFDETNVNGSWLVQGAPESETGAARWLYQAGPDELVLAPDQSATVMVTGIVTPEVANSLSAGNRFESYAEITSISAYLPVCDEGYALNEAGDTCVPLTCPDNSGLNDDETDCVCLVGFSEDDEGNCVPVVCPVDSTFDEEVADCVCTYGADDAGVCLAEPVAEPEEDAAVEVVIEKEPAETEGADLSTEEPEFEVEQTAFMPVMAFRASFANFIVPTAAQVEGATFMAADTATLLHGTYAWTPVPDKDSPELGSLNSALSTSLAQFNYGKYDNIISMAAPYDLDNHDATRAMLILNMDVCPANPALSASDPACSPCPFNAALSAGSPLCHTDGKVVPPDPSNPNVPNTPGPRVPKLPNVPTTVDGKIKHNPPVLTSRELSLSAQQAKAPLSRTGADWLPLAIGSLVLISGAVVIVKNRKSA